MILGLDRYCVNLHAIIKLKAINIKSWPLLSPLQSNNFLIRRVYKFSAIQYPWFSRQTQHSLSFLRKDRFNFSLLSNKDYPILKISSPKIRTYVSFRLLFHLHFSYFFPTLGLYSVHPLLFKTNFYFPPLNKIACVYW